MNATVNFEICQSETEAKARRKGLEELGFQVNLLIGTSMVADILYVRYPSAPDAKEVRIGTCAAPYLLVAVK
jgi:hypothetical protein